MNQRDALQSRDDISLDQINEKNDKGQAYGLELLVQRKLVQRVSATLSYTLARSELGSTLRAGVSAMALPSRPNLFDRTHVLQLASAVDLGRMWFASLRGLLYTGWPDLVRDERLPAFFRLDARLEKRWKIRKTGHIALIFEGLNVTGSQEVLSRRCPKTGPCENVKFGPITVPSIGVEGAL